MEYLKNKRFIMFIGLFLIPGIAFLAQGVKNPTHLEGDLNSIIKTMINGLLQLAIPFLVLAYVYVGFLFVKAQGSSEGLASARKALI
jgi:hypothetical protein